MPSVDWKVILCVGCVILEAYFTMALLNTQGLRLLSVIPCSAAFYSLYLIANNIYIERK